MKNLIYQHDMTKDMTSSTTNVTLPRAILVEKEHPSGGEGNLYVTETINGRVLKVDSCGNTTVFFSGLSNPWGVAVDGEGNVYISDTGNHRIWKVTADGNGEIVTGTDEGGYNGDGILATNAQLDSPHGITIDHKKDILSTHPFTQVPHMHY